VIAFLEGVRHLNPLGYVDPTGFAPGDADNPDQPGAEQGTGSGLGTVGLVGAAAVGGAVVTYYVGGWVLQNILAPGGSWVAGAINSIGGWIGDLFSSSGSSGSAGSAPVFAASIDTGRQKDADGGTGGPASQGSGGGIGGGPQPGLGRSGRPEAPRTFGRAMDAALDALSAYNPTSIRDNAEYLGAIYKEANGRYTTSVLAIGTGDTVRINWSLVRDDATLVGLWHLHGAFDPQVDSGNFMFSLEDRNVAETGAREYGTGQTVGAPDVFRMYLGTPSGSVGVYTPSNSALPVLYIGPIIQPRAP
jgi:hypothetical protein